MVRSRPAYRAVISGSTMAAGLTFRNRIPNKVRNETRTPDAAARIHSPIGMKRKNMKMKRKAMKNSATTRPRLRDWSTSVSFEKASF